MISLVDMHCHLFAGLDDGPKTEQDALEMCRLAFADGTRMIAATAHQNESWPLVTPEKIRQAAKLLTQQLRDCDVAVTVFPVAEVMVFPEMVEAWSEGKLMSLADRGQFLLVEMPHGLFVELGDVVSRFRQLGIRLILAHPERQPEFLHNAGRIEKLVAEGCLVQVSARSLTHPSSGRDSSAVKSWIQRGVVHLLGSDGHSPRTRLPVMAQAYEQIARWAGFATADRIASTNPLTILQGLPLRVQAPEPVSRRWFSFHW